MVTRKYILQLMTAIAFCIAFFMMLGIGGDMDFTDQMILRMSQQEYDHIKDTLTKLNGEQPSESDIAHWWADHHSE